MRIPDVIELTEDEARFLLDLLAAPPGSPGKIKWVPVACPAADASFFDPVARPTKDRT